MAFAHADVKASDRTLQREMHAQGVHFYKLKERQTLTPDDVKERYAWAKERKTRSGSRNVRFPREN